MANNIITNGIAVKTALPILRNKLPMAMTANTDYQNNLTNEQARNGGTVFVKRPPRYIGRRGELMKVESTVETAVPMTLQMYGVDVSFSNQQLQFSMDDVRKGGLNLTLDAAMTQIAAMVESDGAILYRQIATSVGTPGTPPTSTTPVSLANAYITSLGGGAGGARMAMLDTFANASMADSLKLVFNPSTEISKAYMKGRLGTGYGFDFYEEPAIQSHTAGVYGGSPVTTAAGQSGTVLLTSGWTAGSILNAGDTFQIANVFSVNPQTRQSTGKLAFFAVQSTATADGSGNMTINLVQGITPSGQFQNVTVSPAASAALTVTSGTSGQVSRQSLLYDKNAITFARVKQAKPAGDNFDYSSAEDEMSGISISLIQQYDADTNQVKTRFDVLAAWLLSYPELAVRLQG